jgi:hypothetical protein
MEAPTWSDEPDGRWVRADLAQCDWSRDTFKWRVNSATTDIEIWVPDE